MNNSATIIFGNGDKQIFIHRREDGVPKNVLKDIRLLTRRNKPFWEQSADMGALATRFVAGFYNNLHDEAVYTVASGGSEKDRYRYFVSCDHDHRGLELKVSYGTSYTPKETKQILKDQTQAPPLSPVLKRAFFCCGRKEPR